jgi:hypothetical protein
MYVPVLSNPAGLPEISPGGYAFSAKGAAFILAWGKRFAAPQGPDFSDATER